MARPRSEEARQAALEATVDLVLANGIEGVTFEDVAARSGVAKTTLYRHFGSKPAMVVEAARSCFVLHSTPDSGDLAEDLRIIFEQGKQAEEERRVPDLIPALVAAGDRDPELAALVAQMLEEKRRPIRTVLQLAQLRGEIGHDVDLDVAYTLVVGPFVMRRMIDRIDITDDFREAVLRHAVAALRATTDRAAV
ncbi:MAG TPA: TetR/AcrR family transcriptional regulator [Acidimicrobiales bacterium]|nr:TetR/AcrR family transcriptional regulator [Acidimicrobiales bacterium]